MIPLTFDLDFLPLLYILLQNATPSPFLTGFQFCLLYVIALGKGFKTPTQKCDFWLFWPLTCIVHCLQNATPSPFLTGFQFCLLYMIALGEGFKTSSQNFVPWPFWPLNKQFFFLGYQSPRRDVRGYWITSALYRSWLSWLNLWAWMKLVHITSIQ